MFTPLDVKLSNGASYTDMRIIYPQLSYSLNGIFLEVQNRLGRFSTEKQYADGIEILLKENKIPYEREKEIFIQFGDKKLGGNKVDFLVSRKILIDAKSKNTLPGMIICKCNDI